ncbi:cyclase-like protein 1 isoform X1 [Triticum dicoccoides]|uniref:cyclase-like protein 1 isoform X1 n=1 Tax=Triticum dicoccoides TaxID=85692 RepID=UPI0018919337|nr:cyclase-like protein 1 isoform X1 [Triticum dicoccoides]
MAGPPALTFLLLVLLLPAHQAIATAAGDAHGGPAAGGTAGRRHAPGLEEYGGGRIVDIAHVPPDAAAGPLVRLKESMENGSDYNLSELRMPCHMGTHVDAPGHMIQAHFAAGLDVDTLDLEVLNGPALLVDVPRHTNITAEAMESLNIPRGVRRVLFRTLNTDRGLMWKQGGDMSFVGFTEDGAQWLVDNTDIKLVGYHPSRSPETRQHQHWTIHAALLTSKTGWLRGFTNQVHSYQVITWRLLLPKAAMYRAHRCYTLANVLVHSPYP